MTKRVCAVMIIALMLFSLIGLATPAFADHDINDITIGYGIGKMGVTSETYGSANNPNGTSSFNENQALVGVGKNILAQYKYAITGVAGVLALTFVVFFLINLAKLGQSAGNPQMRSHAITAIIWTGIAAACTGGVSIFFGFFYNVGKDL